MTIMSDDPIGNDTKIPLPALALGAAGVLPFIAGGLATLTLPEWSAFATQATLFYGAVILSFLGGIRWGFAMHTGIAGKGWFHYVIAVVPSLFAWGALLVPLVDIGIAMCILGLVGMLLADIQLTNQGKAPMWFQKLRLFLTVGACAGLLMIAL